MSWSPMTLIAAAVLIAVVGMCGYAAYEKAQFQATAKEVCEQIVDYTDNQTTTVREGNYVNTEIIYHGYDVCRSTKDGNVTSRTSLGYGTKLEIKLKGEYNYGK